MADVPQSVGIYQISGEIGRGGMGVVYQGRDTRLDRTVAIKALPEAFASDADRLARFEREARTLASLNHPNVASIFGVEEDGPKRYLILEHVDGVSLSDRLAAEPLPIDEALLIAAGIAAGVEAAHEAGVIHRDLKPGNVKITPEGVVKVLDFGLAKGSNNPDGASGSSLLATQTTPAGGSITTPGLVMGTPAYMSPEQARGKALDKRTDIWSFGCILFECLGGKQPFAGETVTDSLAAILEREPEWSSLSERTPPEIKGLIRHCLEKDQRRRLRDIGDARVILEDAIQRRAWSTTAIAAASGQLARRSRFRLLGWLGSVVAAGLLGAAAIVLIPRETHSPQSLARLNVLLLPGASLTTAEGSAVAISPDGQTLAIVGDDENGRRLYVRRLDQIDPVPLAGTEGALNPFFSPDGRWIGFFAGPALKKVSTTGGSPLTLASAMQARGGTWSDDDFIYFAPGLTSGIHRLAATGGTPEPITEPDSDERSHRWPHVMPDGRHVLFLRQNRGDTYDDSIIEVVDVETRARTIVHQGGTYPQFARSGHLVFVRENTLFAARFDPDTIELLSQPAPVLEGVFARGSAAGNGGAQFAVAHNGTLVYKPTNMTARGSPIAWVDREGVSSDLIETPGVYANVRLSPEGSRLAMQVSQGSSTDIWILDILRNSRSRLTFSGSAHIPCWTPSGDAVAFADTIDGETNLFVKRADGVGETTQLTNSTEDKHPISWSPDGRVLAFHRDSPGTTWDIFTLRVDADRRPDGEPEVFVQTPFIDVWPEFSPDGRWIAYASDESGQEEVYVRPYPVSAGRWQVSTQGGSHPRWKSDGSELYFDSGQRIFAVSIDQTAESFVAGLPRLLIEGPYLNQWPFPSYEAAPDGSRFLLFPNLGELSESDQRSATIIFNWFEELQRLTTTSRD